MIIHLAYVVNWDVYNNLWVVACSFLQKKFLIFIYIYSILVLVGPMK